MAKFLSNGAIAEDTRIITSSSTPVLMTRDTPSIIQINGSDPQIFRLPNALTLTPGMHWVFANRTTADTTVNLFGGTILASVNQGFQAEVRLLTTSTSNGTWDVSQSSASALIGPAEDGSYSDGLFTDFTEETPVGTPTDRFNEVLKELCPPPAPYLSSINSTITLGPTSKLSWGASHSIPGYITVTSAAGNSEIDLNGTYTPSGTRLGAYSGSSYLEGRLAATVASQAQGSYPAYSIGYADEGTLQLELNGSIIHTENLVTFGSGNSTNASGSGFISLSAATPVKFPNGNSFNLFKYRTGYWRVHQSEMQLGFNYARVLHVLTSSSKITNYLEWVIDTNSSALAATSGSFHSLTMSSVKYLSGVAYHTSGYALYDVTLANTQKNLYSTGNPITFVGTNCASASQPLPPLTGPNYENANVLVTNASVLVNNGIRILNGSISVGVSCTHPLKASLTNQQNQSISGLLYDAVTGNSTDVAEYFNAENIRLRSTQYAGVNNYASQSDVSSGTWDSLQPINTSGSDGYRDGLLVTNGLTSYPTQGANGGNFGGIANGPAGNPDYSALTGTRYYYFKFRNNSGSTRANWRVILQGTGAFVPVSTGPSGQNLTLEMKFPSGSISTGTGWMDCYGDFVTGQWSDGNGCRWATNGAGRAMATNWGLTIGTKSLATNEYMVFRIAASSSWTGNVNDIQLTFL